MYSEIISVGTATPPYKVDQEESLALAQRICCTSDRQSRLATALYRHSGVQSRFSVVPHTEAYRWLPAESNDGASLNDGPSTAERMALYAEHALPLAAAASSEALRRSNVSPTAITHVVTVSCTGFTAPGVDSGLIQELGLSPTTQRVHVGYMGCHGAINALRVAHGLTCSDSRARVLLCAVELCSLHYCFHWDSERMLGNALFADGAGAMVIGPAKDQSSNRAGDCWRLAATGSYLFPDTSKLMSWSVGNAGFAMTISSRLPELIQQHLGVWLTGWLAEQGLEVADVQSWAVHPGGPRILEASELAMELSSDKTLVSREVLAQFGNMSSATVLFILERLMTADAARPCVMLGFGPGLIAEAALIG